MLRLMAALVLIAGCRSAVMPGDSSTSDSGIDSGIDSGGDSPVDTDEQPWPDDDQDGFTANLDCDDADPAVNPDAVETCNGVDDDCDGTADDGVALELWVDGDGDGWGAGESIASCEPVEGWVSEGGDCDDAAVAVNPAAEDICGDGLDGDCGASGCTLDGIYRSSLADAKIHATGANERTGDYLDVGDIDGDGHDDVAVTTYYRDSYAGGAAVIYGPVTGVIPTDDAGDRLVSSAATTSAGRSIAVDDLDGDGVDDVVVGAPNDTCRVWVTFGPLEGDSALSSADVIYTGRPETETGHGTDAADVTGDGSADLIVGAYEADEGGLDAGAVYVAFGPLAAGTGRIEESADLTLIGEVAGAYAGRYVRAGSDVDGDGIGDMLLAAPYASDGAPQSGVAYLVYGGITGEVSLGDADARYVGEGYGDYAGEALAMGDVNGDGLDDVLLGSFSSRIGYYSGAAYVVHGPGTQIGNLSSADVVLRGNTYYQLFGLALSAADVDGDGIGELLVGARGDSVAATYGGAAYLYWGPVTGSAPEDAAVVFKGEGPSGTLGTSVGYGDLDGDAALDILLGAPGDTTGGADAGALFVFNTGT